MVEYEINARGVAGMEQLIKKVLIGCGLQVVSINTIDDFSEWLEQLPGDPIPGLASEVANWFRYWGNGGGDVSTEECARAVCTTDSPRELAQLIYDEIAGYSKSNFEAKGLVMEVIGVCLKQLREVNKK